MYEITNLKYVSAFKIDQKNVTAIYKKHKLFNANLLTTKPILEVVLKLFKQ